VYRDAILLDRGRWNTLLKLVFGIDSEGALGEGDEEAVTKEDVKDVNEVAKNFDFLNVWVEKDIYFKNWDRIQI
jgi:hypothetical protein